MSTRIIVSVLVLLIVSLAGGPASAAEMLPEGVTMVVLKEEPAPHLPGVEKVRLVELRMAPGAVWPQTIPNSGFCTALQGTITLEIGDKTVTRFAGDSWVMKKGLKVTAYNRGTVDHVERMWLLIE